MCERHAVWDTLSVPATLSCGLSVMAPLQYGSKTSMKTIEAFKYFGNKQVMHLFAPHLKSITIDPDTVLVPIPLHWRRQFWRGFNQADVIAKTLSAQHQVPVQSLLKRVRYTSQQARLTKPERAINLKNAFSVASVSIPKRITLIDDVSASGATLCAAAEILRANGAESIDAICLARTAERLDSRRDNY